MKHKHSILLKVMLTLVIIPVLLIALIQSPLGKHMLAAKLSTLLSRSNESRVHIEDLSGWIPASIHIGQIELSDADGLWLSAHDVQCRWNLSKLLHKSISLPRLSAAKIELIRRPELPKKAPKKNTDASRHHLPLSIQLDELLVSNLKLGEALAGEALAYTLHSDGINVSTTGLLSGSVTLSGDAVGQIELTGRLDAEMKMNADLEQMNKPNFGFSQLAGQVQALISPIGIHGQLSVQLEKNRQPIHLATPFSFTQTELNLASLQLSLSDYSATANVVVGFSPDQIQNQTWSINLSHLELADADGLWLSTRNVHCGLDLAEFTDKKIHLQQLSASEITLIRRPKMLKKEAATDTEPQPLSLPLSLQLDGLKISNLTLGAALAGEPLAYTVHSGGIHLSSTGSLAGSLTVSGDARGQIQVTGHMDDEIKISADLAELNKPNFGFSHLAGQAQAIISPAGIRGQISAQLEKNGQSAHLTTPYNFTKKELKLDPFQLNMLEYSASGKLTVGFSPDQIHIDIDALALDATTNRYTLKGKTAVTTTNETWLVDLPSLDIQLYDRISIACTGTISPEKVELTGLVAACEIETIPLPSLAGFSGQISGQLVATGSLQSPQIHATFEARNVMSKKGALNELPELNFQIDGAVANGALTGSTELTNITGGHLTAELEMPCAFSLVPFRFTPQRTALQARASADWDLAMLNGLARFQDQHIEGLLQTQLSYREAHPSGFVRIEKGHYEHFDAGIVMRDINADLTAGPDGCTIQHATANDGQSGTLTLSGHIVGEQLDLQAKLAGAKVLRRPEVEAQVSGLVNISGTTTRPNITGALVIDRADVLLENVASSLPKQLTNYNLNDQTNAVNRVQIRKPLPLDLNITISMPDQIFVTASLIDSAWGGKLRARSTPTGLSLEGPIEPRRGYISFIGKKFRFTEGGIRIDGAVPPTAVINNLTAEYERSDLTARLIVSGKATAPQIRLESTPSMPQEEIISLVLFNRDTRSISPYQAFQIANAAKQLSSGLNGPGFIHQIGRAIGMDTFEWREANAEGEASSIAAGKYLTSELYVEVNRKLDAEGETGIKAEYEIGRHFSIETQSGPSLQPGIGINWKNDY